MLTAKLRDLVDSSNTIASIVNTARGKKLSAKVGRYLGTKVIDALNEELPGYYKAHDEIIKGYEYKNAEGADEVPKEFIEDFSEQRNLLLEETRDLLHLYKINDAELESCELTPVEWRHLSWLLVDQAAE